MHMHSVFMYNSHFHAYTFFNPTHSISPFLFNVKAMINQQIFININEIELEPLFEVEQSLKGERLHVVPYEQFTTLTFIRRRFTFVFQRTYAFLKLPQSAF